MSEPTNKIIYFDGACPLCTLEIDAYKRQQGAENLCFVDVSKESTQPGDDLTRERALQRFHVRNADGTLVSGAAAFVAVWAELPKWRWAARLAQAPGVLRVLEAAYRGFLPLRPALARWLKRRRA